MVSKFVHSLVLVASLVLVGCANTGAPKGASGQAPGSAPVEEQPFRPDLSGSVLERRAPAPSSPSPTLVAERALIGDALADQGEDGSGALVSAAQPVFIDIQDAHAFAATAEQPVLRVGELSFYRYQVVDGTLRFVVADSDLVSAFDVATLEHGASRYSILLAREVGQ